MLASTTCELEGARDTQSIHYKDRRTTLTMLEVNCRQRNRIPDVHTFRAQAFPTSEVTHAR